MATIVGRRAACGRWVPGLVWGAAVALTAACSAGEESGARASRDTPASQQGRAESGATQQSTAQQGASSEGAVLEQREGRASFVAQALDGGKTASGVTFDSTAMVAAHPTYPFGTVTRVTNVENGRHVEVRIVDRGPASSSRKEGVIIDLSRAAADALGFVEKGEANVRVEVLRWGAAEGQRQAQ